MISLGPSGNLQRGFKFMTLNTIKKIVRCSWDVIPVPDLVINRVNALGSDQPQQMTFTDTLSLTSFILIALTQIQLTHTWDRYRSNLYRANRQIPYNIYQCQKVYYDSNSVLSAPMKTGETRRWYAHLTYLSSS
jgi:hypothetical protein